jgi:Tol biopolymer transport system component
MEMRNPDDVRLSPDGRQVAFAVNERVPGEQKRRGRIWVVETEGGKEARPITSGKHNETSPSWSPDGKSLAFVTRPEGEKEKPQLHVISLDGGEPA